MALMTVAAIAAPASPDAVAALLSKGLPKEGAAYARILSVVRSCMAEPAALGRSLLRAQHAEPRFATARAGAGRARGGEGAGDELPGLEGFDAASGLAEPTPECRRIMNGWLGECVFGKAEDAKLLQVAGSGTDIPGIDGYDAAAGMAEATPECKKVMNGWMGKCVFSKAADATSPKL